jgi:hypothetical protein
VAVINQPNEFKMGLQYPGFVFETWLKTKEWEK